MDYEMMTSLARIEAKLDLVLSMLNAAKLPAGGRLAPQAQLGRGNPSVVFQTLTVKQHAALQMLIGNKSNAEIAARLGVTENTAKVHVRLLAKKAGGAEAGLTKRQQIVAYYLPTFDAVAPEDYLDLTRGLPKDWDKNWGRGTEKFDSLVTGEEE